MNGITLDRRGILNAADLRYGAAGVSRSQRASAAFQMYGFAEGGLESGVSPSGVDGPVPGRVAFGRFAVSDAAIGMVVFIALVAYLSRSVD